MKKIIRISLTSIILLALSACGWLGTPSPTLLPELRLTVQTQNNVTTFNQAGEVINYQYVITNTGTQKLNEPVIVTDTPRQVICPSLSSVGNKDIYLDQNETVTCTAAYSVTPADVTTGSITNVASAQVGNVISAQTGITLTRGSPVPSPTLKLVKTASSQTYGAAGQTITYTFNITNTATTPLGPNPPFTITDNKLGAPFPCGPADTILAPNQTVSCSVTYTTTAADMGLANITNSATVSGGGQTSAAATVTIANLNPPTALPPVIVTPGITPGTSPLTPGITVQHRVAIGEWLIQIARCYGASPSEVIAANPQITDPDFIRPEVDVVTVPRIGSVGKIYKSDVPPVVPCVTFVTVQSGDTWASLAQRFNADLAVLQRANPGGLVVGQPAKIPLNSAGSGTVAVTAAPGATTAPTATTAQRINIPAGQTSVSVAGISNANQTVQYVLAASQGQMLSISLTGPTSTEATLGVNGPTGLALKLPDGLFTWSTAVTTSGDHYINVAGVAGSSSRTYTLTVNLTGAVTPITPTATVGVTPTVTLTPNTPVP